MQITVDIQSNKQDSSRRCRRVIDTSQTHPLALIGCVDTGAVDSSNQITAAGWSHRQLTCILFYCQINNDNFSKYNKT